VRFVKRYENGFITAPVCMAPTATIRQVLDAKERFGYGGFPVTEDGKMGSKLLGIVCGRDYDFRADLEAIAANLRRAETIRAATADASSIRDFSQADKKMLHDAKVEIAKLENSVERRVELIGKCAQQAADIDRALREERESDVMAKRREDLRGRLGPILYGSQKMPIDSSSESADVVTARDAAFHELKSLIDKHRLDAAND
jgi:CBS domain-containing protein